MKQQLDRALSAQAQQDKESKYLSTLILDTGANHSFVKYQFGSPKRLGVPRKVETPNGSFRATKAATTILETKIRKIPIEALVHNKLPRNLLSTTPILRHIGPVLLDRKGASVLDYKVHKMSRPYLTFFAQRRKGLYEVPTRARAVCLGAQKETPVEARSVNINQKQNGARGKQTYNNGGRATTK